MYRINHRPNSCELVLDSGKRVLFSYETPVAYCDGCEWFKTDEYFSVTTSRHMDKVLPENTEVIDSDTFDKYVSDLRL